MIIDKDLEMSDNQVVTASAPSENVIDTVVAGDAIIEPILSVVCTEQVTGGTVKAIFETSDTEDFAVAKTEIESGTFAAADLKPGTYLLRVRVPWGTKRFYRCRYVVDGALSSGKFNAFICND